MAKIDVIAGDLEKGEWNFSSLFGTAIMIKVEGLSKNGEVNLLDEMASAELMDEEKVKKLGGTAAWGLAGAALLGPLGAIGGMLIGGNKKKVAFACYLTEDRKFLATTDGKTWQKIQAIAFDKS